jgi:hypothetical protein
MGFVQIYPIPKTNAFCVVTIKGIKEGTEITVSYEKTGYYGPETECLCRTCSLTRGEAGPSDLDVLKPGKRRREEEGEGDGGPSDGPAELDAVY